MADLPGALRSFARVMSVPLIAFLGARPASADDPTAGLVLEVDDPTLNAAGVLHSGVIATMLDLAAYLAILPLLAPDEQAVTHHFSATYLSPTRIGELVAAKGRVLRAGRHVAFTEASVRSADRLVATASVTKSIVRNGAGNT